MVAAKVEELRVLELPEAEVRKVSSLVVVVLNVVQEGLAATEK